jgi:aspartyl-tRNA(Asn)/glutamyl-tRNA(Gln) amidotransferase subunit A
MGLQMPATEYAQAQLDRRGIRAELWSVFDSVDVLVTPALATTAGRIGGEPEITTRFTYPFNLSGFPAMSLPCGFDHQGLPIGLQLAAAPWQESLLLRVAHQYQLATSWHQQCPRHEVSA